MKLKIVFNALLWLILPASSLLYAQSLIPLVCPIVIHVDEPEGVTFDSCLYICLSPSDGDGPCSATEGSDGNDSGAGDVGSNPGAIKGKPIPSGSDCCNANTGGGGGGNDKCCDGMPVWSVAEPNLNLFLRDRPFWYRPSRGPEVGFRLNFKNTPGENNAIDIGQPLIFSVGTNWHTPWRSYLQRKDNSHHNPAYYLFTGNGRAIQVVPGTVDYETLGRMDDTDKIITFPNGSRNVYGTNITVGGTELYFLSHAEDAHGNGPAFYYIVTNGAVRLNKVIDVDSRETTFEYTNTVHYSNLIAKVNGPFGLSATLSYNTNTSELISVTDALNMESQMEYGTSNRLSRLITPYGTNEFAYYSSNDWKALKITEANVRNHLYLQGDGPTNLFSAAESEYTALSSFQVNTLDHTNLWQRNSYHWGPRQYSALSTAVLTNLSAGTFHLSQLSTNDFNKGRTRHWLFALNAYSGPPVMSRTLALERSPSSNSDGSTEGLLTWYDHAGKAAVGSYLGYHQLPSLIAEKVNTGGWRIQAFTRHWNGNVITADESYGEPGSAATRSVEYTYDGNKIDVISVEENGTETRSSTFNGAHQPTEIYNALNELTEFAYNGDGTVATITYENGLITSNIYSSGYLSAVVDRSATEYFRTNSYTYTNGMVYTHTDPRGLTVINVYDSLNRLIKRTFPDGTYISNRYDKLDIVETIDRMGFSTTFEYNRFRQLTKQIAPGSRTNVYIYCDCGSLESVIDPMGNTNSFLYDNLGRRTRTTFPGGSYADSYYDNLGQVLRTVDNVGIASTNWYTINGLVFAVSNASGQVFYKKFDDEDRVRWQLTPEGTRKTFGYDLLGRMTVKTNIWSVSGEPEDDFSEYSSELFTYTAGFTGPTRHKAEGYEGFPSTHPTTEFNYDLLQRKTNEIRLDLTGSTPLVTNTFSYNGAGDLLALVDAKNQKTTWIYDVYGRVTKKLDDNNDEMFRYAYDANGRLTNRWTSAKGDTRYVYDEAGNLTLVDYPHSPDITMVYDKNNRLTNMTDAAGSSSFTYTAFGALLTEDGPWGNDTVTYSYTNNRLRSGLSLAQQNASAWEVSYGYDGANRLSGVTSPAGAFTYQYHEGLYSGVASASPLVKKLLLPMGAYITNTYEPDMARLSETKLVSSGGTTLDSHAYEYDGATGLNHRTSHNGANYSYDDLGQLTGAEFSYAYDLAGNLTSRTRGGLTQNFTVNNLNQITNGSRSGTLTVEGTTEGTASSVTVNGNAATLSGSAFSLAGQTLVDGTNTFTAIGQDSFGRRDTNTVSAYLPASPTFSYDQNGNMAFDGMKGFEWDDENQLTRITRTNAWKSEFTYDGKMRRRVRKEYTWRGGSWVLTNEVRYLYYGNLVVQERDGNNIAQVSYTRGKDFSGALEGAGGIGGLLARTDNRELSAVDGQAHAYYHADGMGNVTILISTQQVAIARYTYDPFGNTLSASGQLADANRFRFSSKEWHKNSALSYYLYRYHNPTLQRWLNRDPIEESGGINLYGFVDNLPTRFVDPFGHRIPALCLACAVCAGPPVLACLITCSDGRWDDADDNFGSCWGKCIGEVSQFNSTLSWCCIGACTGCGPAIKRPPPPTRPPPPPIPPRGNLPKPKYPEQ